MIIVVLAVLAHQDQRVLERADDRQRPIQEQKRVDVKIDDSDLIGNDPDHAHSGEPPDERPRPAKFRDPIGPPLLSSSSVIHDIFKLSR